MARVTVTGGCGYVGSVLVPKLLAAGHIVRVFDLCWFGNYLAPHKNLKVDKLDIRTENLPIGATDAMIHLAAIANDPTGDLDPKLTWEVNALATMRLAEQCVREGVKHFIYASSGSVYGVSQAHDVTEDLPLVPISDYNRTKMVAERCVLSYADKMCVQILRPATVCGFSPRMRLDVAVNAITMQALTQHHIKINGGKQIRPNINIYDMADLYLWMLSHSECTGIYNAGFENLSIQQIASKVAQRLNVRTTALAVIDKRSYRLSSRKLLSAGFSPKYTVDDAIGEIIAKSNSGELHDEPRWHNLQTMKLDKAA